MLRPIISGSLFYIVLFVCSSVDSKRGFSPSVRWTPWYNSDQPDGKGDIETLSTLRLMRGYELCEKPLHIQVRTADGTHVRDTKQIVDYSPTEGFRCLNSEQLHSKCFDYKVRFLCPLQSRHEPDIVAKIHEDEISDLSIPHTWRDIMNKQSVDWETWGAWSPCDVTCGGTGRQERVRSCQGRNQQCNGREIVESRPCGDIPCILGQKKCETSGQVLDTTNIPLEGVEIGLGTISTGSFTILTLSDANGRFHVDGICTDASSAHLVARKRNYVTTRIHMKLNESGSAVAKVRLLRAEFPVIYSHPVDKVRMVGQSVKFCCEARGTPKQQIISWFHNGTKLHTSLHSRDPRTLELRNLKLGDAGTYWCKVQSLITSEMPSSRSYAAQLTVYNQEEEVCRNTPNELIQKLPGGCTTVTDNSTWINVGRCPAIKCPNQANQSRGCKETISLKCCVATGHRTEMVNCGDTSFEMEIATECGCKSCLKPTIKVQGRAFGKDYNDPLRYGFIYRGKEKVAVTSYYGSFSLGAMEDTKRLVLTFEDRFGELLTTTKVLPLKQEGGVTFYKIKMQRKSPEEHFQSSDGALITLGSAKDQVIAAEVAVAPNSLYQQDGKLYSGKVRSRVTFIDPRIMTSYEEAPSDLMYANDQGENEPLRTFGMFEIDFRDDERNLLNVGKAKILLPGSQYLSSSSAKNVKLWSLNPENGLWEIEDKFSVSEIVEEKTENSTLVRKKREETFLVGNLEIRERRLYNLDVAEENRCWVKVRAYRSPAYEPREQVKGVEITVINVDPSDGFQDNPKAWGRFDYALTEYEGACIQVFCNEERADAFKAIISAKIDSTEELHAAPSSHPLDPSVVGVEEDVLRTLQYERSDHREATGKKTSFTTNTPKPARGSRLKGPFYPEENYQDCLYAPVTDNHFRFHRTEDFLYEFNTVYMDEHNCITWTPHYLNWWPTPLEYRACYIKIHIESPVGTVVRVKSSGGTHPKTKGKLYGIRDDKSVMSATGEWTDHSSAACIEYKCSGMLYDMEIPDRTLLSIVPQGNCHLYTLNNKLMNYLTTHPPVVEDQRSSDFGMYAPVDALGHNYGIYTVTDDDPVNAKKTALGRCYAGSSDVTSKLMNPKAGVAVYYRCGTGSRDDELQ